MQIYTKLILVKIIKSVETVPFLSVFNLKMPLYTQFVLNLLLYIENLGLNVFLERCHVILFR